MDVAFRFFCSRLLSTFEKIGRFTGSAVLGTRRRIKILHCRCVFTINGKIVFVDSSILEVGTSSVSFDDVSNDCDRIACVRGG